MPYTLSVRLHRQIAQLLILLALMFATSTAQAGEDEIDWYGEQLMIVDAVSLGILAPSIYFQLPEVAPFALASWALAAPVVHLVHHQNNAALGSLGLRVGLPLVAVAVSLLNTYSTSDTLEYAFVAVPIAMAAAMAIDYIFLPYQPVSGPTETAQSTQMLRLRWQF